MVFSLYDLSPTRRGDRDYNSYASGRKESLSFADIMRRQAVQKTRIALGYNEQAFIIKQKDKSL